MHTPIERILLLVVVQWAVGALAADRPRGGCVDDLGTPINFNQPVPLPLTRSHGLNVTIKMLDGYAAAETADHAGAGGLVVSPVTPFARLAMDRVEAYLAEPGAARARGAFNDHDPLAWNRLLTNVDLPLVAPTDRPSSREVDAVANGIRSLLITAHAEDWSVLRTRRAAERILGPVLERDLARAVFLLRVTEVRLLYELPFAGKTVGRVVPALLGASSLLYVRWPNEKPRQLVAYQYRPSNNEVGTLIARDVDTQGQFRDRAHVLEDIPGDAKLIIYAVRTDIASPERARPTLPITPPRAAND